MQLPSLPTTPTEITAPKPLKERDYQSSPQPSTSSSGLKDKSTRRYIHNDKGVSSDSSSSLPGFPIIQLSITSVPEYIFHHNQYLKNSSSLITNLTLK